MYTSVCRVKIMTSDLKKLDNPFKAGSAWLDALKAHRLKVLHNQVVLVTRLVATADRKKEKNTKVIVFQDRKFDDGEGGFLQIVRKKLKRQVIFTVGMTNGKKGTMYRCTNFNNMYDAAVYASVFPYIEFWEQLCDEAKLAQRKFDEMIASKGKTIETAGKALLKKASRCAVAAVHAELVAQGDFCF